MMWYTEKRREEYVSQIHNVRKRWMEHFKRCSSMEEINYFHKRKSSPTYITVIIKYVVCECVCMCVLDGEDGMSLQLSRGAVYLKAELTPNRCEKGLEI